MNNDFLKYIFPWLWFMSNDSDKQDSYGDEMSDRETLYYQKME